MENCKQAARCPAALCLFSLFLVPSLLLFFLLLSFPFHSSQLGPSHQRFFIDAYLCRYGRQYPIHTFDSISRKLVNVSGQMASISFFKLKIRIPIEHRSVGLSVGCTTNPPQGNPFAISFRLLENASSGCVVLSSILQISHDRIAQFFFGQAN